MLVASGIIISLANEHFDLLMVLDVKSVALHSILILPEGKPNFKATHLLLTETLDLYMVQERKLEGITQFIVFVNWEEFLITFLI